MKSALRSVAILLLALWIEAEGNRQLSDDSGAPRDRIVDFLAWAHPASPGCGPPSELTIDVPAPGLMRLDFEVACGGSRRPLVAVVETREGKGVWQIAEGFETDPALLEAALRSGAAGPLGPAPPVASGKTGAGRAEPPGIAPPPQNPGEEEERRPPMPGVIPPRAVEEVRPEYPEEAGRARVIGQARVELLVDVSPEGRPERTRPLRGPDPDLGLHRAAADAVMRWRFSPALLAGRPVRYFFPVTLTFEGLPPEAVSWAHRALFHVEAIVSTDPAPAAEALRRLRADEPIDRIGAALASSGVEAGDWGFVSAAALPPGVRQALHDIKVGESAGPIEAEGLSYAIRKRGEIYYAIRGPSTEEASYQVLHQQNAPEGARLRRLVESDVAAYLAESRRRAYVNEAARLMGIRQRETEIGQLEIHTDALGDEEIDTLGRLMQAAIEAHRRFWEPVVPLRPLSQRILIYAFARKSDHDRLYRIWRTGGAKTAASSPPGPAGEYVPASRILAIPCEEIEGHLPVPILIHEAIHMLDYETVYPAGVEPSTWFEEGLATYFGFSRISGRLEIEPGAIRRSGTIVTGGVKMQFDPRVPLRDYHRRLAGEHGPSLAELLRADASAPLFKGDLSAVGYGASWTLVHFLEDGGGAIRRRAFLQYAALEAHGEGGAEPFARLFGPDLEALEGAWRDYDAGL